jgi:hypothetical protein
MREVLFNGQPRGQLWTASLQETEELVRPEAFSAYARYGIRGVLTAAADVRPRCVAVLPQLCLPVVETGETTPGYFFSLACQFARKFSPLIVHCNAGQHRSRVIAAAIACKVWQMGLEDAIRAAEPLRAVDGSDSALLRSMRSWALSLESRS